ncbi:hypothetical protein KAR91_09500 [Candidatus Pacearchaeota archaeon]|nr:hypothetical protein [Candidatus Pacearchaeota archaeon]
MVRKKRKHSLYCYYSYNCDKDINCIDENFCDAFRTTDQFTLLDEQEFIPDYEKQMDDIWEGKTIQ